MSRNMKEDTGFSYLGTLPNFEKLLEKVSLFTNNDWTKYKKRNTGIAAEYSDTIPIIYDFKLNISSNIRHEHYELFGDHIFDLIKSIREKLGDVEAKCKGIALGAVDDLLGKSCGAEVGSCGSGGGSGNGVGFDSEGS